jgi:four helix bundle protein
MQYRDFTEMPVWQDANRVIQQVYEICRSLPRSEEYALASQIKRSALSIAANIAEGFGRSHSKDKINFYFYARGSAFETKSHLIVGKDLKFFGEEEAGLLVSSCDDIIYSLNKMIKGLGA